MPPSRDKADLAAVQDMFRGEKFVGVDENKFGLFDIRIGKPMNEILQTEISSISFEPLEQYNPSLALSNIENS
jgi:hypothetical protein